MYFKSLAFVAPLIASAFANNITIMVGVNGTKTFNPPSVTANVNDLIHFVFVAGNHSVYQSSFDAPCTLSGFTNAYQPVPANATSSLFTTITMAVNSTAPIWFYCPQTNVGGNHCHQGMVGAVNPTAQNTFTDFQNAALALGNTTNTTNTTTSTSSTSPSTQTSPVTTNNPNNGVPQLRPSMMLTGSSVALLGVVASAMLTL